MNSKFFRRFLFLSSTLISFINVIAQNNQEQIKLKVLEHSKIEAASFQVVGNACNHACNQYGTHVPFTPCATPPRDHAKQPLFMFQAHQPGLPKDNNDLIIIGRAERLSIIFCV
jgi:hypothetical protein